MRSRLKLSATVALLAAMLVLAFSPGAGGATRGDDPRSLAVQVVKWNFLAQYGRIWELLHPRYQAVTTRTFWEACKRKNAPVGIRMQSIKALGSYPDTITLPLLGRIKVTAVTLELRYTHPAIKGVQKAGDTTYWIRYHGTWKGLWRLADYQAYSHHRCPS